MDLNNLKDVRMKDKNGKWHVCKPFVSTVKNIKTVIYALEDGTEIKRESLAQFVARESQREKVRVLNAKYSLESQLDALSAAIKRMKELRPADAVLLEEVRDIILLQNEELGQSDIQNLS